MTADSANRGQPANLLPSLAGRRRPPSPPEQARRVAWGKQAGAKVAAAYKQLQQGG